MILRPAYGILRKVTWGILKFREVSTFRSSRPTMADLGQSVRMTRVILFLHYTNDFRDRDDTNCYP